MSNCKLEKLKIVFELGSINAEDVLHIIIGVIAEFGLEPKFFVHDNEITLNALNTQICAKKIWPSGVTASNLLFKFGVVTALQHCFILIEETKPFIAGCWDNWVMPFLKRPGFVQAWISDVEYDYWQNAKDPLEYEAVGRDYSYLLKKSNGLPPPLEQVEIDISNNPGRNELKEGYVEAVGSTMWLSKSMLSKLNIDISSLRHCDLCNVADIGQTIQIKVQERSFENSTGKEGEIQNRLREKLFMLSRS